MSIFIYMDEDKQNNEFRYYPDNLKDSGPKDSGD